MTKKKDDKPTRSELYALAERELRSRHEAEFQELVKALYEQAGYTYKRRLTKEERDAQQAELKRARLLKRRAAIDAELEGISVAKVQQPSGDEFAGSPGDRTPMGAVHPVSPEDRAAHDAAAAEAGV